MWLVVQDVTVMLAHVESMQFDPARRCVRIRTISGQTFERPVPNTLEADRVISRVREACALASMTAKNGARPAPRTA